MKKLLVVLLLLAAVVSFAFAGGSQEKAAVSGPKPVTLSVLWFNDNNESEVFLDTIQDYLAENPHVTIDLQLVAYNDFRQKLQLMISGGSAPDIARLSTGDLSALIDVVQPLDDYVGDVEALKSQYMDSMVAFAINRDGKFAALPIEATANGMLVNKTAFKNAGIDVDTLSKTWTWAQWEEAAQKVIAANPNISYGLAVDFTPHRFSTLMYEWGGRFLNEDQTGMGFDNPGTIQAINHFKSLHDKGLVPKSVWLGSENPAELFQAGIVASHIGGSWNISQYNTNIKNFEWGAVALPKGTINSSVPGGKYVATFKASPNKDEAVKLMQVFADKAHTEKYVHDTFNISSRLDTEITYPSNSQDFDVFAADLALTPAYTADEWKHPDLGKVTTYIREQIVLVLMGQTTAEQAVRNVDSRGATFF